MKFISLPQPITIPLGLCILLSSALSWALPNDREQPIHITSDKLERDQNKGTLIYEGTVQIDQGSLRIKADKVTIYSTPDNQVKTIIAVGQPAKLRQKPKPEDDFVLASGNTIEYEVGQETVLLLNNASLVQAGKTMTSDRIDYNINQSLVKAGGDEGIQMVLPPQVVAPSDTTKED